MIAYAVVVIALVGLIMLYAATKPTTIFIAKVLFSTGTGAVCLLILHETKKLFGLLLIGALALSIAGCTYCQNPTNTSTPVCKVAQISKQCGAPEVVKLVLQYLPEAIIDLISGNYLQLLPDLVARITALGGDGATVVSCIAQVADANTASPNGAALPPHLVVLHDHATAWLALHPVK